MELLMATLAVPFLVVSAADVAVTEVSRPGPLYRDRGRVVRPWRPRHRLIGRSAYGRRELLRAAGHQASPGETLTLIAGVVTATVVEALLVVS